MTELLREELRRRGDGAPEPPEAGGLWRAARLARRRDRVLAAGLVLAAVGLVAAALPGLPVARLTAEVAGSQSVRAVGVPDRIAAVPQRVLDRMEPTSRPGRAAAAYLTSDGRAVVVSATDGSYHRLRLASLLERAARERSLALDGTWLALSPNGRFVAYAWEEPPPEGQAASTPAPTGLAVLDLTTGFELTTPLQGGHCVVVTDLTWSSNNIWVLFRGLQTTAWTGSRRSSGMAVFGRLDARRMSLDQHASPQQDVSAVTIDDAGTVAATLSARDGELPPWAVRASAPDLNGDGVRSASPDGRHVLIGSTQPSTLVLTAGNDRLSGRTIRIPETDYPEGATVRPVGWVDDTHAVAELVRVSDYDGSGFTWGGRNLVVVDVRGDRLTSVGAVDATYPDAGGIESLTLATGLMTLDRPTVHRPDPRWPWSTGRYLLVGGLLLLVGLLLVVLLRRRPPRLG
ncbi:MAG: hypothetical protein R2731_09490 [Nocardioides sp.]